MRSIKWSVMLFALVLTAAGCSGSGDDGFSPSIRQAYMDGCTTDQNEAFCECTIDEFEKRYTQDEFVRFALQANETPPDPEVFVDVALACIAHADR